MIDIFSSSTYGAIINTVNEKIKNATMDNPSIIKVPELPTTDIKDGVIYAVPSEQAETDNIYDEWVHWSTGWEFFGSKKIDLSDYVQKDGNKVLSDNNYTEDEKNKLSNIEENANKYVLPVASDNLGGVKSGTDITVDDEGNVSVNDNSHNHSADNIMDGYLNIHPDNNGVLIPFINNDIAYLLKRGGQAVVKYDGIEQNVDISNVFDGSPLYWGTGTSITNMTEMTIELTLHKTFAYTNTVFVDCVADWCRAKNIKIEVMNTNYINDVWAVKGNATDITTSRYKVSFNHIPVGATDEGAGFNKIRFTFSNWIHPNTFRIASLGVYNHKSQGIREICLPKDGGELYGSITPFDNNEYDIGSTNKKWRNIHSTNITAEEVSLGNVTLQYDTTNNCLNFNFK